jgi:hypothetical protein
MYALLQEVSRSPGDVRRHLALEISPCGRDYSGVAAIKKRVPGFAVS